MPKKHIRQSILLLGDIIIWYLALAASLSIRSGSPISFGTFERHVPLFSLVLVLFLFHEYIFGRYDDDDRPIGIAKEGVTAAGAAISTFLFATLFFYILPNPSISPKTILLLTIVLTALFGYILRQSCYRIMAQRTGKERLGIIGNPDNTDITTLVTYLDDHRDMDIAWISCTPTVQDLAQAQTILLHKDYAQNPMVKTLLYTHAVGKQTIIPFSDRYEAVLGKIPKGNLTDEWFIAHVHTTSIIYAHIRTIIDYTIAVLMGIILLCVGPILALLIRGTSPGPIIFRQTRIGKHGIPFTIYKFRTMHALAPDGSAETNGAVFSSKQDTRITPIGRFLRKTRLDELPQAWNLFRRDITVIGPRPERPEIVAQLECDAPYFSARTLIMPGITGWAAVKQHYTDTQASTIEKLQYDLYYMKYRSLLLDLKIILLTIRTVFEMKGQ